ncbi:MGDG synthase family glycosyltransferase [Anaerosphaera multitolerans]|uniref:UDP-diphospho-muramoylpentapeptide beta-N-acetylglucosaminyltransferase n=1 Tax=Anaerosphaera multitolerans TaxID=2487351 RepID=A0A437S7U0_9FIRM|nr:glycosyltransferase [Anaerosphaera multitolerans]RVU55136.1 UDP-diphospho-muramoylpentapeptide beta-N-acetylglucosaminyltransferase [Anaerosphaera multitolerans]
MNILILTARFGMGHISVANTIERELKTLDSEIKISTVDLIEYVYSERAKIIYNGFSLLVKNHPEIYNLLYKFSEKIEMDIKLPGSSINKKLNKLIEDYSPDIIISTIPICARTISAFKRSTNLNSLLVTSITDISTHIEWIAPGTDYYLVPSKEIKNHLIKYGVKASRVFTTGVPVSKNFNIKKEGSAKTKNILIMGGGLGLLPKLENLMDRLVKEPNICVTIISGKNKNSYDRLLKKYPQSEIIGFTKEVHKYMEKADIILTKPGGVTLFEAIYSETPMFIIKPYLAQEKANGKFIEEYMLGKVVWENSEDIPNQLMDFIKAEEVLNFIRENMRQLKTEFPNVNLKNTLKTIVEKAKRKNLYNINLADVI